MKKRMKQLMAVMLSVALCVPAIPGAYGYAATSGTTFISASARISQHPAKQKADSYRAEPDGTVKALLYLQDVTESLLS